MQQIFVAWQVKSWTTLMQIWLNTLIEMLHFSCPHTCLEMLAEI